MHRLYLFAALATMAMLASGDAFAMAGAAPVASAVPCLAPLAALGALAVPRAILSRVFASGVPRALLHPHLRIQANGQREGASAADKEPIAILNQLREAHEEFKARHNGQLANMQAGLDEMALRVAALQTGPGSTTDAPRQVKAARDAFGSFAKRGDQASIDAMSKLAPRAAMTVGSDPDGGFLIPHELDATIQEVQRQFSPMRRLARVVQTKASVYELPFNLGGTGSGWVGETASRPQTSSPQLARLQFPAGEIYAEPAASQRLLDDAPQDIAAWLENEIALEFDKQEGIAFLSGDGVNKPRGLLASLPTADPDQTRPFGTYGYVPSGDAGKITADSLIGLVYGVKAGYRQNGRWLMNSATLGKVRGFKDAQGQYLWQPSLIEGQPERLMGYPVEADDGMPDVGAGSFPVAFGDFNRGYLITDRIGVRVLRDPLTAKPFVLFYATKRVGGGPLDTNAIRFLKVGTA